jgi:N-acetylmuramoyl-L-alanine amidase
VSRYLLELADVVRGAGLVCHTVDGWETRARASGGYLDGRPTHVMIHHTASPASWDGQPDVDYIATGADIAPISNLYLSRAGEVWVIAAGATNTNGSGCDSWGGGVPDDSMNSYAIGIEAGNDGVGELWPAEQQSAYLTLVRALCAAYDIPQGHVRAHWEWTGRKIDPAGPSRFASSGSWDMEAFRAELGLAPIGEEYEMIFRTTATADSIFAQGSDMNVRHVSAQEGAIAQAGNPGWADGAPTLELPRDVTDWLETL